MDNLDRLISVIIYADMVGYTSMMQESEQQALLKLKHFEETINTQSKKHDGEIVKTYGDGCLMLFHSVVKAVECAINIQRDLRVEPYVPLRIGIHVGEIVRKEHDIFGDGINIASRIESMGVANSVLISSDVFVQIKNHTEYSTVKLGEFLFKNVERVVTLYAITNDGLTTPKAEDMKGKGTIMKSSPLFSSRNIKIVITVVLLAIVVSLAFKFLNGSDKKNSHEIGDLKNPAERSIDFIAVLPFSNTKPDPETDYFGFAIADQIIGDLVYLKSIIVRPSSAVRQYDKQVYDPRKVGDQLDVDYLLTGSYLKEENIIRLNFELIDIHTNETKWRERIEVDYQNAFALQDKVAEYVVQGMNAQFSEKERNRISKDVPSNPLAYEYYLRSVSYPFTNEGDKLAIEMLNKSIALDSIFAPAYNELGSRIHRLAQYGLLDPDETKRAEMFYWKALSHNEELLSALGNLALAYTETARIEGALGLTKKMLEINPNNVNASFSLGYIYRYAGMNKEAIQEMEKAIAIDPRNPKFRSISITYTWAGEYEKALEVLKNYQESSFVSGQKGVVLFRQGKHSEALPYLNRAIEMEPDGLAALVVIGVKAAIEGNEKDGIAAARKFDSFNLEDAESWYNNAGTYGLMGDKEGCIRCLRRAVDRGFFNYPLMQTDFFLDIARDDPEFQKVLEQAKKKHMSFRQRFF